MSTHKGDRMILGNSMQSLATLLPAKGDEPVRQVFSLQQLADNLPEGYLVTDPLLVEAAACLRQMSPEEIQAMVAKTVKSVHDGMVDLLKENLPEPDHHGDTSHGLNPKWIDWYCLIHNCRVWKAISEGKRRLRSSKETPKRKKRAVNPK